MSEQFTTKDVASHNTVDNGLYIIIDGNVYGMAGFVDEHPGGPKILKRVGPAIKAGCVGTPDQVREQIEVFREMGIELLLFKFPPSVEEVRAIWDEIIAPMRKGEAAMAPA